MYRPGMFTAVRSGNPLPEAAPAPAAPRQPADWNAFGRRGGAGGGGAGGGAGSEHHAAFGRRQPRESREGRRDERPRVPVRDYVPSNSLAAILDHALKAVEPKEEEWQTRLRGLQKKRDVRPLVTPVAEKPKPVDFSSETAFPTLGAAPAPKSAWAPKAQSFAALMKKHVEDDAEAARVESERKAAEERARLEREREERRYKMLPSLAIGRGSGGGGAYYDDDEEYDTYNPEGDLDYQYNTVRREEPEMQADAAEAADEEEEDEYEHVEDSW
jgi:hypothetical protein